MTVSVTRRVECEGHIVEESAHVELADFHEIDAEDLPRLVVSLEVNLFANLPQLHPIAPRKFP